MRFRKKKEKLAEDLILKISLWEGLNGERFLHKGMAIRDVSRQDLEDTKELGALSLAQTPQTSGSAIYGFKESNSNTTGPAVMQSRDAPPSLGSTSPPRRLTN